VNEEHSSRSEWMTLAGKRGFRAVRFTHGKAGLYERVGTHALVTTRSEL
jgi:hypothetical protein